MNLFKSFSEAMILQKSTFFVVWIQRLQQLYKLWLVVTLHHPVCELRWPPATDWWPVYLDVPMSRCRSNSLTPATQMSLLSYHPSMMDHHAWPQSVLLSCSTSPPSSEPRCPLVQLVATARVRLVRPQWQRCCWLLPTKGQWTDCQGVGGGAGVLLYWGQLAIQHLSVSGPEAPRPWTILNLYWHWRNGIVAVLQPFFYRPPSPKCDLDAIEADWGNKGEDISGGRWDLALGLCPQRLWRLEYSPEKCSAYRKNHPRQICQGYKIPKCW